MVPRLLQILVLSYFVSVFAFAATTEWTMLNINVAQQQGDAHLVKFPSGEHYLIDAGDDAGKLVEALRANGVTALKMVLVSHPHKDHYSGIRQILAAGISIGEVRMGIPDRAICDVERPWGCDWGDVQGLMKELKRRSIPVTASQKGDVYYSSNGVELKVLYAFDSINTPFGKSDVNDLSVVIKLTHGKSTALFTGDLNNKAGTYLADKGEGLRADILKVPHHGGESLAPNTFFDRVNAKVALVPAPVWLWKDDRTKRVRDYLGKKKIKTYVNGVDGHVKVVFSGKGYKISVAP